MLKKSTRWKEAGIIADLGGHDECLDVNCAHKLTVGEERVQEILEKLGIVYVHQVNLIGLKDDPSKSFRIADFYLPEHEIFIEYEGGYATASKEGRDNEHKRYFQKKEVYKINRIPCICLYPGDDFALETYIEDGIEDIENENNEVIHYAKNFQEEYSADLDDLEEVLYEAYAESSWENTE